MNRFANANTAGKLSKTVPSPNPGFTKLAGARYTPTIGKVEDFAHGGNLRTLVGARICKVFDLDVSWWFLSPANFVKPGFCKGTIFDSAHTATGLVADARALRVCFYGSVAAQMAGEQGLQAETMAAAASESRLEERCGNHVFYDKVLERSYNDYGYWADGAYHYNICDYLGNVRTVVKSDGTLCERNDYYPFGMLHDPSAANADVQPHKYGGKELDRQNGLDLYDSQARWYDPVLARTTTMDQLAEATPDISPYAWCAANPVRNIDPDGRSTWVINVGNGKYSVIGGDIDDKDPNIYVYSEDEHEVYQFTGESIGETPVLTSFYNSDSNKKEKWQIGAIIDTNDQSGIKFLTHIIDDNPPLLDYMLKARNGHPYDFKVTNGTNITDENLDIYRGMPIGITGDGKTIYTSARDIGNIAAGYVAGVNGLSYLTARFGFDGYQSITDDKLSIECKSTRNAEHYGWNLGYYNTSQVKQTYNLVRSGCFAELWLFNKILNHFRK